ncbi:hypothetical protein K9L97_03305 [Candidatus Woesearchaeota archaeon]|nr:hypothetical protein [Candidatus Woesearchaeota archaeon]
MKSFKLYDEPLKAYNDILSDIIKAKKSIYIEVYIYAGDSIGHNFREVLEKKALEGIKVKLLIDSFGSEVSESYFTKLKTLGAEVKFFRKFHLKWKFIAAHHKRDHRKMYVIDEEIVYFGSLNIEQQCLFWRELVINIKGSIVEQFVKIFMKNFNKRKFHFPNPLKRTNKIKYKDFELIADKPSHIFQSIKNRHIKLINKAKSRIILETPYFVPDLHFTNALKKAAKRGVKIFLITPRISDVKTVDLLKERYLGKLHKFGIKIYYYEPKILHAKLSIIDDAFLINTANLDYRSFLHQYELSLLGRNKLIMKGLESHIKQSIKDSSLFNYEVWKNRGFFNKMVEDILYLVKWFF